MRAENDNFTDTIRLKKIEKPKKIYPQQPILIKTNPFAILWGPIPFTSEYKLIVEIPSSRKQSIQVGISYFRKSPLIALLESQTNSQYDPKLVISGLRLQIANKFYFIQKKHASPFGFFIAPHLSYSNAHISIGKSRAYRQSYYEITHFNINLLFGLQIGRGKKITSELFAGLGYKKNTWMYHSSTYKIAPIDITDLGNYYNSNFKFTLGFTIGYAVN